MHVHPGANWKRAIIGGFAALAMAAVLLAVRVQRLDAVLWQYYISNDPPEYCEWCCYTGYCCSESQACELKPPG